MLILSFNQVFLFFLCQLKICLLCSLTVKLILLFHWVSSLWPATIPNFYAFDPRLNVIEDPCSMVTITSSVYGIH